ncbi:MAG: hypothetical protein JXB38_14720 [Anaerolineales bacterium]|nr:hypothetical protein [Anaerolineales bacterium]
MTDKIFSYRNLALAVILIALIGGIALWNQRNQLTPPPLPATSPQPTPNFIMHVYPTSISKFDYEQLAGISIVFNPSEIDIAPENREIELIIRRVSLIIDSKQVPQDPIVPLIAEESGPYYLGWAVELSVGSHQATFQFVTDNGEIREYSWEILVYW